MTITLGGVTATTAEIAQTLADALYDAPGNQMKCYLKDTPLAGMDYQRSQKRRSRCSRRSGWCRGRSRTTSPRSGPPASTR